MGGGWLNKCYSLFFQDQDVDRVEDHLHFVKREDKYFLVNVHALSGMTNVISKSVYKEISFSSNWLKVQCGYRPDGLIWER